MQKPQIVTNNYSNNPLIHQNRQLALAGSEWVRSFACVDMKPLIICRGPIRKEAMDVFEEMGITGYGILLSEKDSITYTNALAPELRVLTDPSRVHRVPDYTGASKEERQKRIQQIISIAHENGYDSIFAGYGFMAEDEEMVASMENAGLNFIGPCSKTVHDAGLKDEAKRTALACNVSVTPGIDNATAKTLLRKYPDIAALKKLCEDEGLNIGDALEGDASLEDKADDVLAASYEKGIDLYTIDEMAEVVVEAVKEMYAQYPKNRIRLKAISGGGGKGQRILAAPSAYEGSDAERVEKAAAKAPELVREILNEVKTTGVGDNKNVLVELNIETTRHQEIQVVGNGEWCITMGGRDCSLQMHEQKLLEVSTTVEELATAAAQEAQPEAKATLEADHEALGKMEDEAARFGKAVGLDSVSTFECIVDGGSHFFMEMNTRIQVEHRVTELCYKLKFVNPDAPEEYFIVESLVEAMVLIARHNKRLPKPERIVRESASVEARMNATNQALQPHAGGLIENWSDPVRGEIRDDQGISLHNPDTGVFMKYHLAGAYDSNIALLLTTGNNRTDSYQRMAEVLRVTELSGKDLATNLQFHYGLVHWFLGNGINARPTTQFIVPYLTAVGQLKQAANQLDLEFAYAKIKAGYMQAAGENAASWAQALDAKQLLLTRPIQRLFNEPHYMSGWLSVNKDAVSIDGGQLEFKRNPIELLSELYHYLNMDFTTGKAARHMIWDHDNEILKSALSFYASLKDILGTKDFVELEKGINGPAPEGVEAEQWAAVQASHAGYQAGTELFAVLPYIANATYFAGLQVNPDLSITIPEELKEKGLQDAMNKVLVPPPTAKSDEILALSGGMYYPREAPGMETYVEEGQHFEAGDVLYIVEVMKMFNKVHATFAGTIDKVLVENDGEIIKKGQAIFKVTPDEKIVIETPEEVTARKQAKTTEFLAAVNL